MFFLVLRTKTPRILLRICVILLLIGVEFGICFEKMPLPLFTRISRWIRNRKGSEAPKPSLNSPADFCSGFREPESVKFPPANGPRSDSRMVRRKRQSREECRMDEEYDSVLVPSDGVSMSGSESDDSDWAIGWVEPLAPAFQSDNDTENSFAVLVPCYCYGSKPSEGRSSSKNEDLDGVFYKNDDHSGLAGKYIEERLLSMERSRLI